MSQLLWLLLVIFLSLLASLLGTFIAWLVKKPAKKASKKRRQRGHFEDDEDQVDTTRNAPKGAAAVVFWVFAGLGCGTLMLMVSVAVIMLIVQSANNPDPGGNQGNNPNNNGNPFDNPVPPVAEDLGPQEKLTPILGGAIDPTFRDQAPAGGQLIGFDVGLGHAFGVELVRAIQPRYRTAQGETAGRKFGRDFRKTVSVQAKPGYAVGAINVKNGLVVNGFSVQFMRVNGARLDPNDWYSSPWIGDLTGGGPPVLLAGDGTPIIGIIGKRNATDCTGIGLLKQ